MVVYCRPTLFHNITRTVCRCEIKQFFFFFLVPAFSLGVRRLAPQRICAARPALLLAAPRCRSVVAPPTTTSKYERRDRGSGAEERFAPEKTHLARPIFAEISQKGRDWKPLRTPSTKEVSRTRVFWWRGGLISWRFQMCPMLQIISLDSSTCSRR